MSAAAPNIPRLIINPITGEATPSFDGCCLIAECTAAEAVGDVVYIAGVAVGGRAIVRRVDITDETKMPAFGIVKVKDTTTGCLVCVEGLVHAHGLTPGQLVFVGTNGRPRTGPPPVVAVPLFWQPIGIAVDAATLRFQSSGQITRRLV